MALRRLGGISSGHAATAVMLRNSDASKQQFRTFGGGCHSSGRAFRCHGERCWSGALMAALEDSYGHNDIDGNMNNNLGALTVIPTH